MQANAFGTERLSLRTLPCLGSVIMQQAIAQQGSDCMTFLVEEIVVLDTQASRALHRVSACSCTKQIKVPA